MSDYLWSSISMYFILAVRYLFVSGLLYYLLWIRQPESWKHRQLHDFSPKKNNMNNEIKWSLITCLFFAIPSAIMIESFKAGGTQIYTDPSEYGLWYLPVSLALYFFLHDTYFYWTHRVMHHPKFYRSFHKVHHDSPNPTPWTSFSFHPYESFIEAIIIPIMAFIIPIHIGLLLFLLTAMTFFGVVNHTGYEIYPKSWVRGSWQKVMITPTHHNYHHQRFNCNYGLYFRFWDKLMGTDHLPKTTLNQR